MYSIHNSGYQERTNNSELKGDTSIRQRSARPSGTRLFRITVVLFFAVGFLSILQGCDKSVDVLTVTPSSAAPGEIITICITEPSKNSQYRVTFAETQVRPLRFSDGLLTVMVPSIEPGLYTLAVVPEKGESECGTITFDVKEPNHISGREAENLLDNLKTLFEISSDYTLVYYAAIGGSNENSELLKGGFDNCVSLLEEAKRSLTLLTEEDMQVLCQLISGSGLGAAVAQTAKSIDNGNLSKYHEILSKVGPGVTLSNMEFFFAATRLDLISAVLTDTHSFVKALKYTSLIANFVPAVGQVVSAGAWGSLSVVEKVIKFGDQIIDGALPTDLKQVSLDLTPEVGSLLNPGESAFLKMRGTFGSQKPWSEVFADLALDATIETILPFFEDEAREFLDELPGMDVDLRTTYAKELLDEVARVLTDAGFELGDTVFAMPWERVTAQGTLNTWQNGIPLNTDYYYFEPLMQITNTFASLIPFFGDDLSLAFEDLMIDLVGQNSLLTNEALTVDDEEIVSQFDRTTGKIYAEKPGTTLIHANVYRFDQVLELLWLFPIEGWVYLNEDDELTLPNGDSSYVNVALEVTVTDNADPVDSNLSDSPVSGVVPGVFTTDGGSFEISVSPVDENGNLLHQGLTIDNFSFSPIQVAPLGSPDTPVAFGTATPDSIETILPGGGSGGVNVAIVLDSSGSMSSNDANRERVIAAKALVDRLGPEDQAAVFDFGAGNSNGFSDTRLLQGFTSDHALLYQAIDMVMANGGTPLYESLAETIDFVYASGLANYALIVLTDGLANSDSLFDDVVTRAQSSDIPIYAVGLGYDVDFTQLQALAYQTGGTFAASSNAAELQNLFDSIGVAISSGRIIVHASGGFAPAIKQTGAYLISGELRTRLSGLTIPTPFDFRVDVISTTNGLLVQKALGL